MAFLIIIPPFIWLLASVTVKLAESSSTTSDNSYSFSNGGRTCSIRNGKLFVDGVFKRELTAPEMEEVERWSAAFNQVIRWHGHGHMHNGWHNHDGHNHGSSNRWHNHDHYHHDHSGHGNHNGHGHEHANYDQRWPSSHVHHGEGAKHQRNHEHGQHNEENGRRHGYHNHGNGQEYDYYIHGNYARKKRQNIHYTHRHGSGETQLGWHGKREMNNDEQVVLFHGLSPTTHFPHVCDFV